MLVLIKRAFHTYTKKKYFVEKDCSAMRARARLSIRGSRQAAVRALVERRFFGSGAVHCGTAAVEV